MTSLVKENLEGAQKAQKAWYNQSARIRTLNNGDLVLVLLPTSSNTLVAQWQGPYKVIKQVGTVNYLINMHNCRKRERLFHINMLREYLPSTPADSTSLWSEGEMSDGDEDNEIPIWKENARAVH